MITPGRCRRLETKIPPDLPVENTSQQTRLKNSAHQDTKITMVDTCTEIKDDIKIVISRRSLYHSFHGKFTFKK